MSAQDAASRRPPAQARGDDPARAGADTGMRPNFLVIGAPKAGTTSLYHALRRHPQVFMPDKKELRFFAFENRAIDPADPVNRNVVTRWPDYLAAFRDAAGFPAVGEASPVYLASPDAPEAIHRHLPDVRLIAVLREPVSRAFSHFHFARLKGFEPQDAEFAEALSVPRVEHRGFVRERPYLRDSRYGQSLQRYLRLFPRDRILVLFHEDLRRDPQRVVRRALDFIGADPAAAEPVPDGYAASGVAKSHLLHRVLSSRLARSTMKLVAGRQGGARLHRTLLARNLAKPALSARDWTTAHACFAEDIRLLETLLDCDLSAWRSPPPGLSQTA